MITNRLPCFIGQLTKAFILSMEQHKCHFFWREQLILAPSDARRSET